MTDDSGLPIQRVKSVDRPIDVKNMDDAPNTIQRTSQLPEPVVKPKQSFIQDVKTKIGDTFNSVKENAKKQITFANGKRILVQTGNNVANNLKQDVGYLGNQAKSSARNIGLDEKQSVRKYGDVQYPTLFGGSGGYADVVVTDKTPKRKIKQVDSFNEDENQDVIKDNQGRIRLGQKNPIDIFAKTNKTKKEIDVDKKIKDLQTKLNKKETLDKKKKQKKQSLNDLGSVGVISTPFGSSKSNGVIGVDFNKMGSKPKKLTNKESRSLTDMNPYNDPFGSFKKPKADAMSSIFGVSKKPKHIKGNKSIDNNMNSIFNKPIFGGKKKKRGLF